jgi:hypothetical protein
MEDQTEIDEVWIAQLNGYLYPTMDLENKLFEQYFQSSRYLIVGCVIRLISDDNIVTSTTVLKPDIFIYVVVRIIVYAANNNKMIDKGKTNSKKTRVFLKASVSKTIEKLNCSKQSLVNLLDSIIDYYNSNEMLNEVSTILLPLPCGNRVGRNTFPFTVKNIDTLKQKNFLNILNFIDESEVENYLQLSESNSNFNSKIVHQLMYSLTPLFKLRLKNVENRFILMQNPVLLSIEEAYNVEGFLKKKNV